MALRRKYYQKSDGKYYKVCRCCGQELEVSNFTSVLQNGKYLSYNPRCKPCYSKHSAADKMQKAKAIRKSIVELEAFKRQANEQLIKWAKVEETARYRMPHQSDLTIQEFIISTLQTVHSHGRQDSQEQRRLHA